MSEPAPRTRQAGPDDTAAICALLGAVFPDNPKRHEDVLAWQYWHNPAGPAVSLVVEEHGSVVAHYAAFPVRAHLAGRRVLLARGADAAVAPDRRGSGWFTHLAVEVFRRCGEAGMPATLSNPNDRSVGAFLRAGSQWVEGPRRGRPRVYVLPIDDRWLAGRLHVPAALAAAARHAVSVRGRLGAAGPTPPVTSELPEGLDSLWDQVAAEVAYGVVRDRAWWAWRYGERPRAAYRYVAVPGRSGPDAAVAVTERDQDGARFALLLELVATSPAAARLAVRAVARDARERGLAGVAVAALPRSRLAGLARASGFVALPRRLQTQPVNLLVADNRGDQPDLAAAPWSFAWGDADHL